MPTISMGDLVRDERPDHDGQTGVVLDVALLNVEIDEHVVRETDLDVQIEKGWVVEIFSVVWGIESMRGQTHMRGEMMQSDEISLVAKHSVLS